MQAYCMKSRAKKEMKDAKSRTMKMANQQLKVYAPPVVRRCSELGRHDSDYNTRIKYGPDISTRDVQPIFLI